MCFLYLIKQNDRIWFSTNSFGQLTTFIVTYISWRCSDQSGYGVFLHVFTHIKSNHVGFIVKQACSQSFCQLGFTNTGRSKEEE